MLTRHSEGRSGLPDFERPPVTEVVLGVQFDPLPIVAPHIGLFWQKVRAEYPRVQQQPTLDPAIERFGIKAMGVIPGLKLMNEAETPRCWFLDETGSRLIQVQADRLIHNWRKRGDSDLYPHYDAMRASFLEELRRFHAFVQNESLGVPRANQCEVTYINNIQQSGVWENFGQADSVFRVWGRLDATDYLPEPEDVRFAVRYVIHGKGGSPLGRLHVNVQPAYLRKDESAVFAMTLTARGAPEAEGIEGVMDFLDLGHRCIVRAFDALTTAPMHQVWGKHAR